MELRTMEGKDYSGKKVFLRVDFNVPLAEGAIADDTRIRAAIPTIEYLLEKGAALVIASHLGRPKGKLVDEMSLKVVAERLGRLIHREVKFSEELVGEEARKRAQALKAGEVMLLENVRFYKEEEEGDEGFARELSLLADCYVNDAFGTCHRKHASVFGITKFFEDKAAGFLIEKEVKALNKLLDSPEKPFLLILGGAKVSDKIGMVKNLLDRVDAIITGGVLAYTFVKAKNWETGASRVEEDYVPVAKEIIKEMNKRHLEFHTPLDHVISDKPSDDGHYFPTERGTIPKGWIGVDIGPQAVEEYVDCIRRAKTIFWNGPMGIFEIEAFSQGTMEMAKAIAEADCFSVIGGGDSASAVNKAGVADKISHMCTGGGASLEYLEKGILPGIEALKA